ncbi:MAG: MBL fold metallo-hydrolase [Holosporales bacterium]|jgi:phosphoribosyl 1,2-cyclic phosphate phosphodiesterase|nr:MBL fold metallo-hydrolase [Holosporales bacterium]
MNSIKVTILGCGSSGGVPCPGFGWGECDPHNPKNYRLRSSLLIESSETTLLIDTSPDLRLQLLAHNVKKIDAILYTHGHADHTNGIDDVRPFYTLQQIPVPIYADESVLQDLMHRFSYLFLENGKEPAIYRPFLVGCPLKKPHFCIRDLNGIAIPQDHRYSTSFGFRFRDFAYSTDVYTLSEEALTVLSGVKIWIVGCLAAQESPSHARLDQVLSWVERLHPQRTILTHMNHTMDYNRLRKVLPPGVEPGFDGISIQI